jgi:hypothetical protein
MLYHKKGMELAMSTIVTAAIAVLVLVIIVLMLTGKFTLFQTEARNCIGDCVEKEDCTASFPQKSGCDGGLVCCVNMCEPRNGQCIAKDQACGSGETKNIFYTCEADQICCVKG